MSQELSITPEVTPGISRVDSTHSHSEPSARRRTSPSVASSFDPNTPLSSLRPDSLVESRTSAGPATSGGQGTNHVGDSAAKQSENFPDRLRNPIIFSDDRTHQGVVSRNRAVAGENASESDEQRTALALDMDQLQLVSRLQRDLASALDSKQVSQKNYDELSSTHEKATATLETTAAELAIVRRQLAEAQRSEETGQNDLSVAVRQGAKLSKQLEQSQADVATLKADVYKLGQQLLESMNAQDHLMDQSMLLLKQRDEAARARDESKQARDEVLKELERLREEHATGSASSSTTQLAVAAAAGDTLEAMRLLRDAAVEQRHETSRHLAAARDECQELRGRLAAKERLLQEQCRRLYSSGGHGGGRGWASDGSGGYSSSDGSHSDGTAAITPQQQQQQQQQQRVRDDRLREVQQEQARLRKELKAMGDECDLLRQQCLVAKKERADSLTEQEVYIARSYRLQQELDAVKEELVAAQQSTAKLKAELGKAEQALRHAQKEKLEAQQSRDWAFEERSRIIRERDMARADSTELQRSRDKAVSDHVATMRDADTLRHELDDVTRELHNCRALRDCYQAQLAERALYWQADYISKEVAIRKGIDGQLGFTIGGGQDNPDPKLGSYIQVVDVLHDGPAAGILNCSDLLIMVNNQDLTHVEQATAARMLREATSPLHIVLRRQAENAPFEVCLSGYRDYGIQLESHIVVTGLTEASGGGTIARQFNVLPGDRILKVDSMVVTNVEIGRVTHSIRTGKRNNPIRLTLFRPSAAMAVRRPFSAGTAPSARRSRSMGSGSGVVGGAAAASTVPSSYGTGSSFFGDSVSQMVVGVGDDGSSDMPSSGHGTMSSGERSVGIGGAGSSSHHNHRGGGGVRASVHSRTSSQGSSGDQSRTAAIASSATATTATSTKGGKPYSPSLGPKNASRVAAHAEITSAARKVIDRQQQAQRQPAAANNVKEATANVGTSTQTSLSGSGGRPSASANGSIGESTTSSSSSSGKDSAAAATTSTGASTVSSSSSSSSSSNPLAESVKHGEQRLQALQRSRARNEVATAGRAEDASLDVGSAAAPTSGGRGNDKTKSMPANMTAPHSSSQAAGSGGVRKRQGASRRGSLPPQLQSDEQHRRASSLSSNSTGSSSSAATGGGSQASAFIEAGVGGSDSIHSLAQRSTHANGRAAGSAIRFVVLSRNPSSGTLGFCIQGGNSIGIFISEITDRSAALGETPDGGLQVGDRILEVNGTVLSNATREMAASCLRQSTTSVLITVRNDGEAYKAITQPYDSLWYRANFAFLASHPWQLTFAKGALLHVIDTMPRKINYWEATVFDAKGRAKSTGMIPNRISVLSGQVSGITSLESGSNDPFSDAEPPPPPAAAAAPATVASTVF